MKRYFKVTEISKEEFRRATGEELDCCQLIVPFNDKVYVAIDDEEESEMSVDLFVFDEE
jgi:hypothetical protein